MHEHWQHKKQRSPLMTNADIDRWYDLAHGERRRRRQADRRRRRRF